ncbi:MAG: hypothetical protein HUJ31_05595 [Pseudomonadales bacterium]|nr:hypothetical protein [Pseudomonadales bacterium]
MCQLAKATDESDEEAKRQNRIVLGGLDYKCTSAEATDALDLKPTLYAELNEDAKARNSQLRVPCFKQVVEGLERLAVTLPDGDERDIVNQNVAILTQQIGREEQIIARSVSDLEKYRQDQYIAKIASSENWYAVLFLGGLQMPEYDENGENQGFQKSSAFGSLEIDARYEYQPKCGDDGIPCAWWKLWKVDALHIGLDVSFLSTPVVSCDPDATDDAGTVCSDQASGLEIDEFNDISDTVNASLYAFPVVFQSPTREVEFSMGVRVGMQSREKLTPNQDSVNEVTMVGGRFVFNDFVGTPGAENGMPRLRLEVLRARYEDWAGLGTQYRNIVHGTYRIIESQPIYIGFRINGEDGPDELALTLSYGFKANKMLQLFE